MEIKNYDSDIYLYAKHWYKRGNIIEDLQKIIGKRSILFPEHVSVNDILIVLSGIVCKHYFQNNSNADHWFSQFIEDVRLTNSWRIGAEKTDSFEIRMIRKMLSMISLTEVKKGDEILIELDEPDYNLLPKSKEN